IGSELFAERYPSVVARLRGWVARLAEDAVHTRVSPVVALATDAYALALGADPGRDVELLARVVPGLSFHELAFCCAMRRGDDAFVGRYLTRFEVNPNLLHVVSEGELANCWLLARAFAPALADHIGDLVAAGWLHCLRRPGIGEELAGIGARILDRRRRAAARPVRTADQPLRIALCVSGQLRGFVDAAPTWRRLGLWQHQLRVFVSTWRCLGVAPVDLRQIKRGFSGQLHSTVADIGSELFAERYPSVVARLREMPDVATEQMIRSVIPDAEILIEDDDAEPFAGWSNQEKMLYKIDSAHQMAASSGEEFDLEIRLRPDYQTGYREPAIDWRQVLSQVRRNEMVLTEFFDRFNPMLGPVAHDCFGIAIPERMADYSAALRLARDPARRLLTLPPGEIVSHRSIEEAAFMHGFRFEHYSIAFQHFLYPRVFTSETLLQLVSQDIGGEPRDDIDERVLAAIRADLSEQ
ncbi:MAG: hypothetical protein ACR2J8_08595, partial [Thermomicrobiales bacterium]